MSEPEGRSVAEAILKAASGLNTHPEEIHNESNPYYWEPEYPDEQMNRIGVLTVVSHNLHYAFMSTYNFISNMGFRILDFFGYTGSDYDWIQQEIDREREDEEYERREHEESIKYQQQKEQAQLRRQQDKIERGDIV